MRGMKDSENDFMLKKSDDFFSDESEQDVQDDLLLSKSYADFDQRKRRTFNNKQSMK